MSARSGIGTGRNSQVAPTIVQTLLFAQQGPVQRCEVKGCTWRPRQERNSQGLPGRSAASPPAASRQPHSPPTPAPTHRGLGPRKYSCPILVPSNRVMLLGTGFVSRMTAEAPWEGQKLTCASSLYSRKYCCVRRKVQVWLPSQPVNHGSCAHRLPGVSHMYPPFLPFLFEHPFTCWAHTPPCQTSVRLVYFSHLTFGVPRGLKSRAHKTITYVYIIYIPIHIHICICS